MKNELMIQHLNKNYGDVQALKDVTLNLSPGIYGLLGHNGAGKSTLMNILTTSLPYSEGEILWNGENIHTLGREYRRILGYMPQQQSLSLDLSVQSFLFYMAAMKKVRKPARKIHELLKSLGLYNVRRRRLGNLSGGMRQRALIAQALLNDPQLLLLDEPTAGLDPLERRHFRDIIADTAKDRIILLATHVISDVEFIADQIIMMKDGKVLAVRSQAEYLKDTHVYEMPESEMMARVNDPTVKIVNRMALGNEIMVRFLSANVYPNEVPASMEDVYLDWLG